MTLVTRNLQRLITMKSNTYEVVFKFPNKKLADEFLGYMCDGGGECYFVEEHNVVFDYHSENKNKFGPIVKVGRVK